MKLIKELKLKFWIFVTGLMLKLPKEFALKHLNLIDKCSKKAVNAYEDWYSCTKLNKAKTQE